MPKYIKTLSKWIAIIALSYVFILSIMNSVFSEENTENESGRLGSIYHKASLSPGLKNIPNKTDSLTFVYKESQKKLFTISINDLPDLHNLTQYYKKDKFSISIDNFGNFSFTFFTPYILLFIIAASHLNLKKRIKKEQEIRLILLHELEDRFRMRGSNLHDVVINPLKGLAKDLPKKIIKKLESEIPEDESADLVPKLHAILRDSSNQISTMANKAHDIYRDISPPVHLIGLKNTIESYIEEVKIQHPNVHFIIDIQEVPHLDTKIGVQLFRILQESIGNSLLHSKSKEIVIALHANKYQTQLSIKDHGIGFHVPKDLSQLVKNHHTGVANIRYRAESIGAHFAIASVIGYGTTITISFSSSFV